MTAPLLWRASTTSTQEDAKTCAREGCAHGTAVGATVQTHGRGRRGRAWLAGEHGLWLSVVLRFAPALPIALAPRLPLCACARIAGVLDDVAASLGRTERVFIKWPNDFMVAAATPHPVLGPFRKAGGLLVEAVDVDAGGLATAVLGVGINLRTPAFGFPADLVDRAAACFDGDDVDAAAVGARVQAAVENLVIDVDDDAFAGVRARLAARSATLGRRVSVDGVTGTASALADDGALVIVDDAGHPVHVHAGDVAVV